MEIDMSELRGALAEKSRELQSRIHKAMKSTTFDHQTGETTIVLTFKRGIEVPDLFTWTEEKQLALEEILLGPVADRTDKSAIETILNSTPHDFMHNKDFGIRISNCLNAEGCVQMRDVVRRTPAEVAKFPNMGPKHVRRLREYLRVVGLDLGMKVPQ